MRIEIPDLVAVDELGRRAGQRARPQGGGGGRDRRPPARSPPSPGRSARSSGAPGSARARCWRSAGGGRSAASSTPGLPQIPGVLIVPATGGMQQHLPHFQVNEFVRLAAEQLGGTPHFIHAPYLPSAATRDAFLADPAIAESVALWDRIDVAPRRHRPAAREELAGGQRRDARRAGAGQRRRRRDPPLRRRRGPPGRLGRRGADDRRLARAAAPGAAGHRRRHRRREGRRHPRRRPRRLRQRAGHRRPHRRRAAGARLEARNELQERSSLDGGRALGV